MARVRFIRVRVWVKEPLLIGQSLARTKLRGERAGQGQGQGRRR